SVLDRYFVFNDPTPAVIHTLSLHDALPIYDLVALDGLETVAGERADELALFDAHNRAAAAGTQLLYAARCNPDALPPGLPDLRRSEEHTSELQSRENLVCRLLLEKKKN